MDQLTDWTTGTQPTRATHAQELERAALELFLERSIEATTVEMIAERAGTSRRTFFYHFPTKDDVLVGNVHQGISRFSQLLFDQQHDDPIEALLAAIEVDVNTDLTDELAILRRVGPRARLS